MSRRAISKWRLAYHSKYTPWKKRAARGHERAAQKRAWRNEARNDTDTPTQGDPDE